MRAPNLILVGLLAIIASLAWPQTTQKLEAGKLYRLAKDTPIIAKHPRDYAKKPHEADFGTITGARTLRGKFAVAPLTLAVTIAAPGPIPTSRPCESEETTF